MTHGERWLAKAFQRIEGCCKSRGWRCGSAQMISRRRDQYEVFIGDRAGTIGSVVFEMDADKAYLIDDTDKLQDITAVNFEASKRQLMLPMGDAHVAV